MWALLRSRSSNQRFFALLQIDGDCIPNRSRFESLHGVAVAESDCLGVSTQAKRLTALLVWRALYSMFDV